MQHRLKTVVKQLPLIIFVFVLLFSLFTAYHYANHILDSDAASELVLGKLLADENKIATSDWLYSTELRAFNTNLIYMPLFKIFSNWHTVRFVASILFQILMLLSYFYLSRQMKISLHAYFMSASLMLLPTSVVYGRLVLYHDYYTPCIIYGFLIAGLYLSFIEHRGKKQFRQVLRLAAMLLLSIMSCMNGFRQFPATMLPLLVAALIAVFIDGYGESGTLADIPKHNWAAVGAAAAVFAAGTAGLFINKWVLSRYFYFTQMENTIVAIPAVEDFRNIIVGYLSLFGFQEGRTLFSIEGLLAVISVPAAISLLIVSLSEFLPRKQPVSFQNACGAVLYPVSMLCMTAMFVLISSRNNYPQYFLPVFAWVYPYLGLQMQRMPVSLKQYTLKQALVILSCACIFFSGVYNNLYYLNPKDKQVTYDPLISINEWDHLEGAIEFIRENELEVGYATFWNANILMEASNGLVQMISLRREYPHSFVYYDALTSKRFHDPSFVEGRNVFWLLTHPESDAFSNTELAQYSISIYTDDYFRIYTFDFASDVWDYLKEQAVKYKQQTVLELLLPQAE